MSLGLPSPLALHVKTLLDPRKVAARSPQREITIVADRAFPEMRQRLLQTVSSLRRSPLASHNDPQTLTEVTALFDSTLDGDQPDQEPLMRAQNASLGPSALARDLLKEQMVRLRTLLVHVHESVQSGLLTKDMGKALTKAALQAHQLLARTAMVVLAEDEERKRALSGKSVPLTVVSHVEAGASRLRRPSASSEAVLHQPALDLVGQLETPAWLRRTKDLTTFDLGDAGPMAQDALAATGVATWIPASPARKPSLSLGVEAALAHERALVERSFGPTVASALFGSTPAAEVSREEWVNKAAELERTRTAQGLHTPVVDLRELASAGKLWDGDIAQLLQEELGERLANRVLEMDLGPGVQHQLVTQLLLRRELRLACGGERVASTHPEIAPWLFAPMASARARTADLYAIGEATQNLELGAALLDELIVPDVSQPAPSERRPLTRRDLRVATGGGDGLVGPDDALPIPTAADLSLSSELKARAAAIARHNPGFVA